MAADRTPRTPPKLPLPLARGMVRLMGRLVFQESIPVEKQRARLAAVASSGSLPPGADVASRAVGGVTSDVVSAVTTSPASADARRIVHFHGGGYIVGTPATSRSWAAAMAAATGAQVIVPDYRLAPEHPHPAALDDAAAVWKELTSTVEASSVVVSGDSAGAGLALALAARLRDEGSTGPAGIVLISPWLDLTANRRTDRDLARRDPMLSAAWLERAADAYSGGTPLVDPTISPMLGSLAGLPPVLVQSGADDILVPDALRFTREATEAGVDVTLSIGNGLWHDFPMQAGMLAAADAAVRQAAAFFERVTSS